MAKANGMGDANIRSELNKLDRTVEPVKIPMYLADDEWKVRHAVQYIERQKYGKLAVDCEGVHLGRGGYLTFLQIGGPCEDDPVMIFDILKTGKMAFDLGLKRILESKTTLKFMYDCRSDSFALWHEFGVRLSNVYDIQLLEYIVRMYTGGLKTILKPIKPWHYRRAVINGMGRAVKFYLPKPELSKIGIYDVEKIKNATQDLMEADETIWRYRPVTEGLKIYAALDVVFIWKLFVHLTSRMEKRGRPFTDGEKQRLKVASERYAGVRRDVEEIEEMFLNTRILQSYIIPKLARDRINLEEFPTTRGKCNGCKRMMPSVDREKLCVDCTEIKRVHDAKIPKTREEKRK